MIFTLTVKSLTTQKEKTVTAEGRNIGFAVADYVKKHPDERVIKAFAGGETVMLGQRCAGYTHYEIPKNQNVKTQGRRKKDSTECFGFFDDPDVAKGKPFA